MEPLRNIYNDHFFNSMISIVTSVLPGFKKKEFLAAIHTPEWQQLALKERIRHISKTLGQFLPGSYRQQVAIIIAMIHRLREEPARQNSFPWLILPDFVEVYGLDDMKISLDAMEVITAYISCEFAIRPFLLSDPDAVMKR